eukprot:CAMPEP_0201529454 /NCGR_PEP_ID=MMETSP0161_2-20130828/41785_1 /ASSEMBLY_ACC=CAM_ASM_000251 /TAXON_ID=180227 /ORGANISM="Neoparamoeba aestuarina, Strain SoJaBio B1-5/56/2" /LENGTH=80 /DNA_ID=CAMNT_0047931263 /DNA_START=130 /DNA_END=368 /DNA_ORIENTATION=+
MISQSQFFELFPTQGVVIIPVEMMVAEAAGDYCPPLAKFVELMDPFRLGEREAAINDMLGNKKKTRVVGNYKSTIQDKDL